MHDLEREASMMRYSLVGLALLAAALTGAAPADAQAAPFQWRGTVAQGQTVEIRGVIGGVRAMESQDGAVHVEATRTANRSDPSSVRIEVVEHADGVTICAVYPTPRGSRRDNECRPGGGQSSVQNNDTQVAFVVRVPAGVRLAANVVTGSVRVEGLRSDVTAATVNGGIDIHTTGFVRASTVNGSITGRLEQARVGGDTRFETVNGSITLELADGLNANFRASTVSGRIDSDFPITVTGQVSRRSLRGTIGTGGPELRASTVNGSIRLRRI
jgi:hypothetical protein